MRLPCVIILSVLLILTTCQVPPKPHLPPPNLSFPTVETSPHHFATRAIDLNADWEKAWGKGSKLSLAMIKPEASASTFITPVHSRWDGDLVADFRTWGYRELPGHRDDLCDFGAGGHNLQRTFSDLGIETTSSAYGGPNKCWHVEHQYGLTVERDPSGQWPRLGNQWYKFGYRRLRETEAYTTLGTNTPSGALYFFNRLSPFEAAHANWNVPREQILKSTLPDLSSSGDVANINKIFMCMITNDDTLTLINEALRKYPMPPGTTFEMHYDAAQVWLGSPNGQAAGYFLAQHKHRFGKSKTVEKVTVFRPDKDMMLCLLFWVVDAPPAASAEGDVETEGHGRGANAKEVDAQRDLPVVEQRVVERSMGGKNVLPEHVVRARL